MDIGEIREAYATGFFRLRIHAQERMIEQLITAEELGEALDRRQIIEEYPHHHYGPCCLVYGPTEAERPLHILVAPPPAGWVITVYEPDPERWIEYRIRKAEPRNA